MTGFPQAHPEAVLPHRSEIQQCIIHHDLGIHHEIMFLTNEITTTKYGSILTACYMAAPTEEVAIGRIWISDLTDNNGAGNTLRLQSHGKITGQ